MALQYGIFAANYPLTEDDFEGKQLPAPLRTQTAKLFGLTIAPSRLQQIRNERRPGSRYASLSQCEYEVRAAEGLFQRYGIPHHRTRPNARSRKSRAASSTARGSSAGCGRDPRPAAVCRASRLREIAVL